MPKGQKMRAVIEAALLVDPAATNAEIAARVGANPVTVWGHRKSLGIPQSPVDRARNKAGGAFKAVWGPFRGRPAPAFPLTDLHKSEHDRFLSNVDVIDDANSCWEWRGRLESKGYGAFCILRDRKAHRVAWEIANGRSAPADLVVRHRCDNPPCVRPSHLLLGTNKENTQDMVGRGRGRNKVFHGDAHHASKIPDAEIPIIRAAFAAGDDLPSLGARYGVDTGTIGKIVRRLSHAHVDDGIPAPPKGALRWERHRAKWAAIRESRAAS